MDELKNEGDTKSSTESGELSRSSSLNSIGQYIADQEETAKSSRLLKRRLFAANDMEVADPNKQSKRRRSITNTVRPDVTDGSASSPSHSASSSSARTPDAPDSGAKSRLAPRSERQQMAMLMQMGRDRLSRGNSPVSSVNASCTSLSGQLPSSSLLPSSFCNSSLKRSQFDKKANKRNDKGETLIHLAAIRGDIKCVKHLIRSGVNVNIKDYAGWTPLHESCNHGWLEVTNILLRAGARVNVQGYDNDTPLHDAVTNGHKKLVELLLRYGANPSQQNSKGEAPEHIECSQVIRDLLSNPPSIALTGGATALTGDNSVSSSSCSAGVTSATTAATCAVTSSSSSSSHVVVAPLSSGASSLDEDEFYDSKEEAKNNELKRAHTPPVQRNQPPLKLKFKKTIHEHSDLITTTTTVMTITSPSKTLSEGHRAVGDTSSSSSSSSAAHQTGHRTPIKPLIVKTDIMELSAKASNVAPPPTITSAPPPPSSSSSGKLRDRSFKSSGLQSSSSHSDQKFTTDKFGQKMSYENSGGGGGGSQSKASTPSSDKFSRYSPYHHQHHQHQQPAQQRGGSGGSGGSSGGGDNFKQIDKLKINVPPSQHHHHHQPPSASSSSQQDHPRSKSEKFTPRSSDPLVDLKIRFVDRMNKSPKSSSVSQDKHASSTTGGATSIGGSSGDKSASKVSFDRVASKPVSSSQDKHSFHQQQQQQQQQHSHHHHHHHHHSSQQQHHSSQQQHHSSSLKTGDKPSHGEKSTSSDRSQYYKPSSGEKQSSHHEHQYKSSSTATGPAGCDNITSGNRQSSSMSHQRSSIPAKSQEKQYERVSMRSSTTSSSSHGSDAQSKSASQHDQKPALVQPLTEKKFERISKPGEKSSPIPDWQMSSQRSSERSSYEAKMTEAKTVGVTSTEKLFRPVDKSVYSEPSKPSSEQDKVSPVAPASITPNPATTFTKLGVDKHISKASSAIVTSAASAAAAASDKDAARRCVEKFYVKSSKPFDFQPAMKTAFEGSKPASTDKVNVKKTPESSTTRLEEKGEQVKVERKVTSDDNKPTKMVDASDDNDRSTATAAAPSQSTEDIPKANTSNSEPFPTKRTLSPCNEGKDDSRSMDDLKFDAGLNATSPIIGESDSNLKVKLENRSISPKVPPLKIFVSSANNNETPRTTSSSLPLNTSTPSISKRPTTSQLVQSIGRVRDDTSLPITSQNTTSTTTPTVTVTISEPDSPPPPPLLQQQPQPPPSASSSSQPPTSEAVDDISAAIALQKLPSAVDIDSDVNSKDSFSNLALEQADSPASSIATSKPIRSRRLRNDKAKTTVVNTAEDGTDQSERRVTRAALRSQQLQQQSDGKDSDADTSEKPSITLDIPPASAIISSSSASSNQNASLQSAYEHVHPRKRKLRQKTLQQENPSSPSPVACIPEPLPTVDKTVTNPFTKYYSLKNKSIKERFLNAKHIIPKAPPQYELYTMVKKQYSLHSNKDVTTSMAEPPNCLPPVFRKLFVTQEKQRFKLSRKHQVEIERLKLSCEEQTIRVHGIATRAQSSHPKSTPISVCGIVLMEKAEHALPMDDSPMPMYRDAAAMMLMLSSSGTDPSEPHSLNVSSVDNATSGLHCNAAANRGRNGYNGRHLIGWLRDINDKFEKLKDNQLSRQQNEAEALLAMQRLEWSWISKSFLNDKASSNKVMYSDEKYVPMIVILEDFSLLPIPSE